jgi:hypothetical protein
MPDQPYWYQRIPDICAVLEGSAEPVLDRLAVEQLFGLRRRQAIRILGRVGGYQLGRSYLVRRDDLLGWLRSLDGRGDVTRTQERKKRIWQELRKEAEAQKSRAVRIPVAAVPCSGLPEGVALDTGRLEIRFEGALDLLSKLAGLAEVMGRDYEEFERRLG